MLWYDETFENRTRLGLRVERTLFSGRSDYQTVEVLETPQWGRVLVIDGVFMTSEGDERFYHEMIVHPALVTAPRIARVLVIGGGDGGTVREVLRHPGVEKVVLVEIDAMVVEACKAHLPALGGDAWNDPRLEVRIGDGVAFVKESKESFDVVLLDGTDPVGPAKGLFDESFYRGVRDRLASGGVFALQSESPILLADVFFEIQQTLRRVFVNAHPYFGPVPLYGAGIWSWTWASNAGDPRTKSALHADRIAPFAKDLRVYSPEVHLGAFTQPPYVARRLARGS